LLKTGRVGRKVSDRFTVPLCRLHHHELHRRGNDRLWWQQKGVDPLQIAKALWEQTHASPLKEFDSGHPIDVSVLPSTPLNYENEPIAVPEVWMTSPRQIVANRRNARLSTGPVTDEGKQRTRCNALRHGLTAETVIKSLEDTEDYAPAFPKWL
jgi:hypothetical protein